MLKRRSLLIIGLLFGLLVFAFPTFASAETNENAKSTQAAIFPTEAEIYAMSATEIEDLIAELEGEYPSEGEMPQEAFLALSIARGQNATIEQDAESDRKTKIITGAVAFVVVYSAGVVYYFERKKKNEG